MSNLSVNITNLLSNDAQGMPVLVEQCLNNILLRVIVKLSILSTLSVFWRAPVIATCGYYGNSRM